MSAPVIPPSECVPPPDLRAEEAPDVLLITGSRSLARTRDSAWWTWCQIASVLLRPRPPARIFTGDSPGVQAIARSVAFSARIPTDVYGLDGLVRRHDGDARWHEGPVEPSRTWPLTRTRAMLNAGWRAQQGGARVEALILRAPWSTKGGTLYAVDVARDLRLAVDWRLCPEAFGSPEWIAARAEGAP